MRPFSLICLALTMSVATTNAEDRHPMMSTNWWATAGVFRADRDFEASASARFGGGSREFDLEGVLGLDDSTDLFMSELGWQFAQNWGLALQYFRSSRSGSRVLEETFEWQDTVFDVGARLDARTELQISRFFFARRFRNEAGAHSLRIGAGVHWLSFDAEVSGEARINDTTTEFRRRKASAEFPFPNIGAWYRYSPNRYWLFNVRLDWLSASIENYSGDIWNIAAGVNYRASKHVGIGASYQYFELAGGLTEPRWRGDIEMSLTGPYLFINAFW